jgi:quercetin dioxygenase-like cupin family protein
MNATRALLLCVTAVLGACAQARPVSAGAAEASRAQPAMTPPLGAESATADSAHDPTITDGDKYKVVTENARVRVLRYHDTPGAKTHPHHHPDSVLHALSAFKRRLTFPDGRSVEREFKTGDVMWVPAQTHTGENIGTTDTDVVLIEVK